MLKIYNKLFFFFRILHDIFFRSKILIPRNSYSQEGEDKKIIKFFRNLRNGFYVDVGAYNPIRASNTYLLHKRGWQGINVDADYFSYKLFNILRPKDHNFNFAVTSRKKKFVNLYYPTNSSQIKTINEKFRNIVLNKFNSRKVPVATLNFLIRQTKFYKKKIDFLNIDCEGEDYEVLKSLDLKIYRPRLICIEINTLISKDIRQSKVYKYLIKNGYTKKYSFINSHIFIDLFRPL
jgi:FkbM family methyltransferase